MEKCFVSNNKVLGTKVLTTIENELSKCTSFSISVAFITSGGIVTLLETLRELEQKKIPGKILTTDYLMFSDPKALNKLNQFSNIDLRMYNCQDNEGFHTKGYIFDTGSNFHVLMGSSNLTQSALTKNIEWNTSLIVDQDDEYKNALFNEFAQLWNSKNTKPYSLIQSDYQERYEDSKSVKRILRTFSEKNKIESLKPNLMQEAVIKCLNDSYERGDNKGLLISATGTGKTYASAFAIKSLKPKRVLFLVHREQIAKQALKSYKRIFQDEKSYGLLSGNSKEYGSEFLFSTMQMMAKDESLSNFRKDEFDIILIDEVHRAGAVSYQKIMNYFKPKYWFGMSASPERTDGFDIYSLFDHNILYEIRLQQALEDNLLCPFHYFGIRDLEIDGEVFDDTTGYRQFSKLVSDLRVDYIIEKANFYGYSGNRPKGLIFCSNKEEAKELSRKFNERGIPSSSLTGEDSQEIREECIERLVSDTRKDYLEYIFTVDIFNEGVDIPEINQVLMLRPTQSAIIFVQQLGRGLRKSKDKEFVVIIDFIGNYKNNFLIPVALSGDRSYNKDTIRRYLQEGNRIIPGSSTIHFDEISKKRIYESIDTANFNDVRLIKDSYLQLKYKLGRIPNLMDFDVFGSIDPIRIFDNKNLGSYHMFLKKYEKEYNVSFSSTEEKFLEIISKKFASGKRPHELLAIHHLMYQGNNLFTYLKKALKEQYQIEMMAQTKINLINLLTNEFATGTGKKTYEECVFIQLDGDDCCISESFAKLLENEAFKKQVDEVIKFGLYRNSQEYSQRYENTSFQLYSKYTYEDVCRLLEWEKGEVALNIGGYKFDKNTNTYPVFINYDKDENIADTVKYEDHLVSPDKLIAISKSNRTVSSDDVQTALNSSVLGIDMELFIRKNKDDKISKEFYYMGKIIPTGTYKQFVMPNTNSTAVEIEYRLKTPIKEDLYDYIVNS
ncbi:DEAD/DEAH box helicase [Faecalitalea cylindroides]|uniref:DEAD/DEAH box helicase n=1 Tax=Faecalitalea cylindroides TaxID=39483 RepID=UPI0022E95B3D|nr:DEAD/DEAH box helicase [Faecalitalea cylindroides]